jgi:hypothetical protein
MFIDIDCVPTLEVNNFHAVIKYSAQARSHLVRKFS